MKREMRSTNKWMMHMSTVHTYMYLLPGHRRRVLVQRRALVVVLLLVRTAAQELTLEVAAEQLDAEGCEPGGEDEPPGPAVQAPAPVQLQRASKQAFSLMRGDEAERGESTVQGRAIIWENE